MTIALLAVSPLAVSAASTSGTLAQASPAPSPSSSPSTSGGSSNQQQAAPQPSTQPPIPSGQSKPSYPALGDFGNGLRTSLANRGLTLNAHFIDEAAGNISGGRPIGGNAVQRGTANAGEFGAGFDEDLGKTTGTGLGSIHFLMTSRIGSSLAGQTLGNFVSVNEIYGAGQTTRVTYLDYEQPFDQGKVLLRVGKQNEQDSYTVGSTYWGGVNLYCEFQNNNVCGSPAEFLYNNVSVAPGSEGYVYYPVSQYAARLKISPTPDLYVQASAIQENPYAFAQSGGAYFGFYGGVGTEFPAEIGYEMRNAAHQETGNVRIGGYFDTSNVLDYRSRLAQTIIPSPTDDIASTDAGLALVQSQLTRGRSGADIQLDHLIAGSSDPGKPGTVLFAAAEYTDPNTSIVSTSYEAGLVRHGTFASRPLDSIGIAGGTQFFNPRVQNLETSLRSLGFAIPYTSSESFVELNYTIAVMPGISIRPGFQYVINPYGESTFPTPGYTPAGNALIFDLSSVISL